MMRLRDKLMEFCKKKIITYHGDNDAKVNATLQDVNKAWKEVGAVITNIKITVGVNYDELSFDKGYLLVHGSITSPRDVILSSYRVRQFKENLVVATIIRGPKFGTHDTMAYPGATYQQLCNDIHIEEKSLIFETFKMFCDSDNYQFNKLT